MSNFYFSEFYARPRRRRNRDFFEILKDDSSLNLLDILIYIVHSMSKILRVTRICNKYIYIYSCVHSCMKLLYTPVYTPFAATATKPIKPIYWRLYRI